MAEYLLMRARRIRRTPFSDRVEAAGVQAYSVYNHMLLPGRFTTAEDEYRHLKTRVQVWDVGCERQIEVRGRDAARLLQMLTPRDLRPLMAGQCAYTPMVDETGGMLNDPVTVKLAEDRFWISIADSDLLLWVKALAYGFRLEVDVTEPDVWPLAVQGPKADDLVSRVFGEAVRDIRFFRFYRLPFHGHDLVIARSGYSKQGGFEIYLDRGELAEPLWDALMEAGQDLQVRPGCPNLIERIEGRLLSYGNDMTRENTPHECGLGRFCNTLTAIGCVGRDALLRVAMDGPLRQIRSLAIEGEPVPACVGPWPLHDPTSGERVGQVTSAVWSPDFRTNVAIGMVDLRYWNEGTRLQLEAPDGPRWANVREAPFA